MPCSLPLPVHAMRRRSFCWLTAEDPALRGNICVKFRRLWLPHLDHLDHHEEPNKGVESVVRTRRTLGTEAIAYRVFRLVRERDTMMFGPIQNRLRVAYPVFRPALGPNAAPTAP